MIKFKFWRKTRNKFYYNQQTGGGMAVVGYSFFTDKVKIRHSMFGMVTVHQEHDRSSFERKLLNDSWDER